MSYKLQSAIPLRGISRRETSYKSGGFTLIEMVLSVFIISMLVITILGMFSYSLRMVSENKLLMQATTLSEEKMEIIKNFPYDSVGTIGGIPQGTIPQSEDIIINGTSYNIQTLVIYIDDPADGILGVDPSELFGTDYKKVRLQISWNGPLGTKSQILETNIAPKRNQNIPGTGTLSIIVFNADGQAVPQAQVRIRASTTIDINAQTNNQGRLIIPGTPVGLNIYSIVTTKAGYSTNRTCSIQPAGLECTDALGNPVPTKPDVSVIEGDFTEVSFAIDLLSQMNIKTIRQAVASNWVINTDASAYDQDNPSMAICPNGNYIFTWRDKRQNNNPRIYAQMYDTNLVKQWSQDLAVTTSNNQNNPDIAVDRNCNIYASWNDDRNGNQDIYYEKFNTTPISEWGGSKKLDTVAESADQTLPQNIFGTTPPFLYVVWLDSRDGSNDIYSQKINPNTGAYMWTPEIKVNVYNGSASIQNKPRIYIDSTEHLIFVWQDNRNGHSDIFSQKMDKNGGILWANDIKMNSDNTLTEQIKPSFVVSSTTPSYLYIVWQDERGGNFDIYAQKYDSDGNKIWTQDIQINSDTGSVIQENPAIVEDGAGKFYIVWEDSRNGNPDLYMQKIDPNGNKLISFDTRINMVNQNEQGNPDIYINKDGFLTVSWQDNNGGNFDVMAATYNIDPQVITNVANVPLHIFGSKRIGENPVLYKYDNNFTTDGSGDLSVGNLEWDQYTLTASGYTILLTEPPLPINLNPNQAQNVIINLQ